MEETVSGVAANEDMLSYEGFRTAVLNDYKLALQSRETSLLGRKEVLTGKAKFGIFGDGKEVAQVAMAKFFQDGDFRSGYYRDQTFMFATGSITIEQFFSQLYADPHLENEPSSAGRQMNGHFGGRLIDDEGNWLNLTQQKNISADISPTAGQMTRGLGLAFASSAFRHIEELKQFTTLSNNGNEICFCTIGDASTSEGPFWETINAAGVLQVPLAVFVWDDGYGISVPKKYQTTKASISSAVKGFQKEEETNGIDIYKVKGWDYAGMCETFEAALQKVRETHTPALFHVEEVTQPQGHSTSGSHERYKTVERLEWEKEYDCIKKMREWILENGIATSEEVTTLEQEAVQFVRDSKNRAWEKFIKPIRAKAHEVAGIIRASGNEKIADELMNIREPLRRDILSALAKTLEKQQHPLVNQQYEAIRKEGKELYNTHLYAQGSKSALNVKNVPADIPADAPNINGSEVLNRYFDQLFNNEPKVIAFGEDLGHIGDVNQGFVGLQDKYGERRIFDTGIRELTIIGQGIGLAMRGLRPIAEIQYLDYLLYGLQPLSDDVATLHYRTRGQQSCPLIVRTRGHRLEGIWHSGSPMGMIINALRGMYVGVPRNMTQAVGMYNTLLRGNDPGLVIECLNGYRLKEKLPANLLDFTVPLGVIETLMEGDDITLVSYGSTLRIVMDAARRLKERGVNCEVIDVQTLLPFDLNHGIIESLKKTNRILFIDEDVPGGAAAYMFNKVMEEQKGFRWLDASPRTLTAKAHRPAYGSDGDYFSKPNAEDIIETVLEMMAE